MRLNMDRGTAAKVCLNFIECSEWVQMSLNIIVELLNTHENPGFVAFLCGLKD